MNFTTAQNFTTLSETTAPGAPGLPPFVYTDAYIGTNLFLACLCAIILGVCFISIIWNGISGKLAQVFVVSIIAIVEIFGYTLYSPMPISWVQKSLQLYLSLLFVRSTCGLIMQWLLLNHWLSLVFFSGRGQVRVFTPLFFWIFLVGSAVLLAVYITWIVMANSSNFSTVINASQYYNLSSGIFVMIFGVSALVVIIRLAFSLADPDAALKRRFAMTICFAAVLLTAASLLLASQYQTFSLESSFGIGVAVELLQQIAFILVVMAFWPELDVKSSDEKKSAASSYNASSAANTNTFSHTMEIDD